jgi:chorismate synthase
MSGSTWGTLFRLTTFGESHGSAIGGVIDGVPPQFQLDLAAIQQELDRRRPGQSKLVTQRKESDQVEFLSGLLDGQTTGAPIGFIIRNADARSQDYDHLKNAYRPSHADYTYQQKYGIRDHRGGGRSSARETACRVVGGAVAKQILEKIHVRFSTYVDQLGNVRLKEQKFYESQQIEASLVRCPEPEIARQMESLIMAIKKEGDTVGGAICSYITGVPAGLGEPVFDKLQAELGKAMLSINAVKGFEIGSGFSAVEMRGSEHNDLFQPDGTTQTNHSGGIQGGISNGMPIVFRVAFKPVATLLKAQESINERGESIELQGRGRHDACVVPRAVPIVESMAAMVILDFMLRQRAINN